jgi:MacB-like periplasmic core domain/FtsX-like permease family
MGTLLQNLRYAYRSLFKAPTLALSVVLTLAICIGATTAVFSVVYAVLFRPLPFADPDGILIVREKWRGMHGSVSVGNWADTKREDRLLQYLVPTSALNVNLAGTDLPEQVTAARVGADFFALLGVPPALGRGFLPEEDRPGADAVVVLSDGLWRRRFGADPAIVGRDVRINGLPRRVVGVNDRRTASLAASRFSTMLLSVFGGLALLLAAIGVYGVISYGVSQRSQEIGIRVALGAGDRNVLRLIVGHAALLTGVGLLLGLTGSLGLSRLISGLLFRVSPTDPPTLAIGIVILTCVAMLAAALPAVRATRTDPVVALRAE